MVFHYIKTLVRNLQKQKLNSLINILGLSLGLAISLLIWMFVLHQLSYDRFLNNHENIYRLHSTIFLGQGEPQTVPTSFFPVGEESLRNFPEVQQMVRFTSYYSSPEVIFDDQITTISGIMFADSAFFDIFNFEFIAGDPVDALKHPANIVLSESTARRLAGDPLAAMNQMITIQEQTYQISGVMQDLPDNTHMHFNAMARQEILPDQIKIAGTNFYTYLELTRGANITELENKLDALVEDIIQQNPLYEGLQFKVSNHLMNVADIHLHSNLTWEMRPNGRYRNVVIFSLLGIFILIIAIINYVNLATARSTLRSKEIGIRKVVGASRNGLVRQIVTESLLVTLISFVVAFAISEIASGYFSQTLGVSLKTSMMLSGRGLILILSALLLTGVLAGLYPALFMAGFDPVKTLKGQGVKGKSGQFFRRSLVVFQFAITIFIISSLLVLTNQLRFMQSRDLGFDQEQVVLVRNVSSGIWRSSPEARASLQSLRRVKSAAGTNFIYGGSNRIDLIVQQGVSKEAGVTADILTVDEGFFDVMGIEFVAGRNIHAGSEADLQEAFILNQSAVDALGLEDPINTPLDLFTRKGPLIGVVKDFHLKSLHQSIEPLVLIFAQRGFPHLYLRVTPGSYSQLVEDITRVLQEFDPAHIPDIIFLDQRIQSLYQQEQHSATLLSAGALLAIIISVMGVYGLASFSSERRIKEIGVRQVLGASLGQLLWTFNKESVILVGISFLIAAPLSWFIMEQWLNNFAFSISINPIWLIYTGIITLVLSSATISIQAWLTFRANPVKSLRAE